MYPRGQLDELALVKAALRRRIARRRAECVEQSIAVGRPVLWLDRAYAKWRQIAPFAKLAAGPVGILLFRTFSGKGKLAGQVLRWGPALWNVWRSMARAKSE